METKVSKYNIEVEHNSCMLLYNSLTNRIQPISYKGYAAIETLMEHLPIFHDRYPDIYKSFIDAGFIIPSDFDELAYIKLQNKKKIYAHRDYRITINPTLDCNLKCWYCSVSYSGAKHNRERMSDETIASLKKHISILAEKEKADSIFLDWFGGEPLMYFDEVISEISQFAKKTVLAKNIGFAQQITTNGTLLNKERIKKMKDYNFVFFQITLDGYEQRHDQIRYYSDKCGSYRDIIENINLLCGIIPNIRVCVRINYDMQTLKNIKDIIKDLSKTSKKNVFIDFQRVWQVECTDEMRNLLKEAKEEFKNAGFHSGFWAYRPQTYHSCYADSYNYYVVNYNGKIFKCTARNYGDDMIIGNLQSSGRIEWNEGLLGKIYEKPTFENERCETCNMLPLCMGPCIQKGHDMLRNNSPFKCLYEGVEYSLSSFVIEMAKRRNFIKE